MINIDFELQSIEQNLFNQTGQYHETQQKIDNLRSNIDGSILDIVDRYIESAVSEAEGLKAYDFAELIDIRELYDGLYEITTINGQTDFSIPEIKMLPNLLRNGKTSKDGVTYRTIPITDGPKTESRGTSVFDVLRERQQLLDGKRQDRQNRIADIRAGLRGNMANAPHTTKTRQGDTKFVTASSRQDPNVDWVIPKVDKDMTSFLYDLNYNLAKDLEEAVRIEIEDFKIREGV